MKTALLKLKKSYVVNSKETNESLRDIHHGVYAVIQDSQNFQRFKHWEHLGKGLKDRLNKESSEYAQDAIKFSLKKKLPVSPNITDTEKELDVIDATVEILAFTEDATNSMEDSLVIKVSFITDEVTVVDSLGDTLFIAKGNQTANADTLCAIKDVMPLKFTDGYSIAEYTAVTSPVVAE